MQVERQPGMARLRLEEGWKRSLKEKIFRF